MNTNDETTIQRDWYALKSGDVIRFADRWQKVFDAYCGGPGMTVVVLIGKDGVLETHWINLRKSGKVTCRIH